MHSNQIKKILFLVFIFVIAVSVVALPASAADPSIDEGPVEDVTTSAEEVTTTPEDITSPGETTTNLPTLFDVCMQFWQFWLGDNFSDPTTVQLLSAFLAIGIVYFVLILPFFKLCKGGRKS